MVVTFRLEVVTEGLENYWKFNSQGGIEEMLFDTLK